MARDDAVRDTPSYAFPPPPAFPLVLPLKCYPDWSFSVGRCRGFVLLANVGLKAGLSGLLLCAGGRV